MFGKFVMFIKFVMFVKWGRWEKRLNLKNFILDKPSYSFLNNQNK